MEYTNKSVNISFSVILEKGGELDGQSQFEDSIGEEIQRWGELHFMKIADIKVTKFE